VQQQVRCHKCSTLNSFVPPLGRGDECEKCRESLRVCLNCRFYDRNVYRECRENQAEWVQDKSQANFCGYFEGSTQAGSGTSDADKAKAALNALFGNSSSTAKPISKMELEMQKFLEKKKT
jgi:hypothetical protein